MDKVIKINNYVNKESITDKEFNLICEYVKIRNNSNVSQRKLASKTGMAQSTIARIEKNVHTASLSSFIKLIDALDYHIELKKN